MTQEQYLKNLMPPVGTVDVVLDTDAFNEIDDQYAISYMVKHTEKFRVKGICAAPFTKPHAPTPKIGMERSYEEIRKLLQLLQREDLVSCVYPGAETYLADEKTPSVSPAAQFMAELAKNYTAEQPLYIVAIGAVTNVASALLLNPNMKETCVIVWLGGKAMHMPQPCGEYNMRQDIAAARVVYGSEAPLVMLPCAGVVDRFITTEHELRHYLAGKNTLCDYLCSITIRLGEERWPGKPWSKPLWDVTAVAWLLNEGERFMKDRLIPAPIPQYDWEYGEDFSRHLVRYVYHIDRDALFEDLFGRLAE